MTTTLYVPLDGALYFDGTPTDEQAHARSLAARLADLWPDVVVHLRTFGTEQVPPDEGEEALVCTLHAFLYSPRGHVLRHGLLPGAADQNGPASATSLDDGGQAEDRSHLV